MRSLKTLSRNLCPGDTVAGKNNLRMKSQRVRVLARTKLVERESAYRPVNMT